MEIERVLTLHEDVFFTEYSPMLVVGPGVSAIMTCYIVPNTESQ